MPKKGFKKTGKSRGRPKAIRKRTFQITAFKNETANLRPEDEIKAVYDLIRKNPGLIKSGIIKKHRSLGMKRQRLLARWSTIRDYLRDVKPNRMTRTNPDGEPWIFGLAESEKGKRMKYYAVDPNLDFVPADPVSEEVEYAARGTTEKYLARKAREAPFPKKLVDASFGPVYVEGESEPEPVFYSQGDECPPEPTTVDYVVITYKGTRIEVPLGSNIRLD